MCSQQMGNAQNDEKNVFFRAILEILLSPPHSTMGESMIRAKFPLSDVLIITVMINFICNFQPFL